MTSMIPLYKSARAYLLYGGISGLTAALGWPKEGRLDWRFWGTIVLQVLIAWKALGTKPSAEPPGDTPP